MLFFGRKNKSKDANKKTPMEKLESDIYELGAEKKQAKAGDGNAIDSAEDASSTLKNTDKKNNQSAADDHTAASSAIRQGSLHNLPETNKSYTEGEDATEDNFIVHVANDEEHIVDLRKKKPLHNEKLAASNLKQNLNKKRHVSKSSLNNDPMIVYLLDQLIIDETQLDAAYFFYKKSQDKTIGDILVELGYVSAELIKDALHNTYGIENFDISKNVIDRSLLQYLDQKFAEANCILPIAATGSTLYLAIHDVYNVILLDKVKRFFPYIQSVVPVYVHRADIMLMIDKYYGYQDKIAEIWKLISSVNAQEDDDDLGVGGATIADLLDAVVADAVRVGASDIHFEPTSIFLRVRYRVDGALVQKFNIDLDVWESMMVRIKIMADMNIAERRHPQDGRISMDVVGRKIDLRVSSQPVSGGENCVMRILDSHNAIRDLMSMGYGSGNEELIVKSLTRSDGIIMVVGPTGSGKTTTLYSMLSYLNKPDVNIMTAEDPIEYTLPLIRQSSVSDKKGAMTFEECIRALMRQDPDIIFIGEIRDLSTASLAARAAMTGHKVLTSLHANDAIGAIPRLIDIGIDPTNLSSSITCVVSQRLARVLCPKCKQKYSASEDEKKVLGISDESEVSLYRRVGCEECSFSGCLGRTLLCEVLFIDSGMRALIAKNAKYDEFIKHANTLDHFVSMKEFGKKKVVEGVLDLQELISRVDMVEDLMGVSTEFFNSVQSEVRSAKMRNKKGDIKKKKNEDSKDGKKSSKKEKHVK